MPNELFLTADQLRQLTGCAQKAKQVEQLRRMGVPFWVNARGQAVVACSAVNGAPKAEAKAQPRTRVEPRVFSIVR